MKLEKLVEKMNGYKKGTFVTLEWESDISSAKAKKQGISVTKRCKGLVRLGINYSNIKEVQQMIKDNEADSKPVWFEHTEHTGIIQNKKDSNKKYLQVFTVNGNSINTVLNSTNNITDKETLLETGLVNKSSFSNGATIRTFTLNVDNILQFGK